MRLKSKVNQFLIMFILLSCGSSESEILIVDKISNTGIIFNHEIIEGSGFKINKNYDIEDLPKATKAFMDGKVLVKKGAKILK